MHYFHIAHMHRLQKLPTEPSPGARYNFLCISSCGTTGPQAPGQKANNSFYVHLPLVSRHMNIKKAIRLECKRARGKRTETNLQGTNKSVICVRRVQPLSHALGVLVFFSTFQVSPLLLLLSAGHLAPAASHQG